MAKCTQRTQRQWSSCCHIFFNSRTATDFWIDRFKHEGTGFTNPISRFEDEEQVVTFYDPDGLELELVAHKSAKYRNNNIRKNGPIPSKHAIRGFYSVTLAVEGYERTASVLTKQLGFQSTREEGNRFRYELVRNGKGNNDNNEGPGSIVDVLCLPYSPPGYMGVGTVHPTDKQQIVLRREVIKQGLNATPVIDRIYFHSVYFRESGGVLFEIATNPPGLARNLEIVLCFLHGLSQTEGVLKSCYLKSTLYPYQKQQQK
jgi:glyoxalase family protein